MSSELRDDTIQLAEGSEALSLVLNNVASLQDRLVNVLASSLRSFAGFIDGINKSYKQQELEYLDVIRNEVHGRLRVLLVNLNKFKGLNVPLESESQSALEGYEKELISMTNTLTVTQYLLAHQRSGRKPAPAKEIPSILAKLEEACTHLLYSNVFPPLRSTPPPNTNLTVALYEARFAAPIPSRNQASYLLICPRAAFPQWAAGELEIKFRCCCEYHTHDAVLTYQVLSEGSIPVEEIGPEMDMTWTMFLRRGGDQSSVRLTSFEGLSLNHSDLSNFVGHLRKTLASMALRSPTVDRDKYSEMIQFTNDHVSVLRAKIPASPLMQALYQVDLDYHRRPAFYDEPYFWIFFSQKSPASLSRTDEQLESFSVRVSHDTQVMKPHPPTEVTVTNAFCISKGKNPASADCSEIRFKFYNSSDAKAFYNSASAMKSKIFNESRRHAFWKENIIYRQNPELLVFDPAKSVEARFALVHARKNRADDLRLIMTRDLSPRTMCFDLGLSLFDGTNTDLTKTLGNQKIWTVDISYSGYMDVDRPSWAQLVATSDARKPRVGAGTGSGTATVKLTPSSAAEDWFVRNIEELNLVVRAKPKLRETGDNYSRAKIAVIDTGLMPNHHMAKQVKYRDFVAEAAEAKQKNNRPVTGESKDDTVQVPQDTSNSKHGTISVEIILRVYEEADLYVARVFEHDEAEETKEPFLMAEAIHWAIEQHVDIISISAGFKTCPLPLRTAVHAAYTSHTLIFAAASNWGNNDRVAFPARIRDQVFCIFATNGLLRRTRYDPEPRACADNFAILGEDVQVAGGAWLGQGTSAATAVAAGFAARILDFVSQTDISTGLDGVELLKRKVGMTAVFKTLVRPQGLYECIKPAMLLKYERYDASERTAFRQYVKKKLMEALENVE